MTRTIIPKSSSPTIIKKSGDDIPIILENEKDNNDQINPESLSTDERKHPKQHNTNLQHR